MPLNIPFSLPIWNVTFTKNNLFFWNFLQTFFSKLLRCLLIFFAKIISKYECPTKDRQYTFLLRRMVLIYYKNLSPSGHFLLFFYNLLSSSWKGHIHQDFLSAPFHDHSSVMWKISQASFREDLFGILKNKNWSLLNLCMKGTRRAEWLTATPWKEPRGSAPWRKFRVGRTMDVASQFLWWLWSKIRRRVNVGLATNDHTNVRMQINPARLTGHKSKMYEVA